MITFKKVKNKWSATSNGLESSFHTTKKKAVEDLLETERFIRIAKGEWHEKDCHLGQNHLDCRVCVETRKYS